MSGTCGPGKRSAQQTLETQLREINKQIEAVLDRIVKATNNSIVRAYEDRVEKLERQKIRLLDQAENSVPPQGTPGGINRTRPRVSGKSL